MCGFAGSVNFPLSSKTVKDSMIHRGPDDQNGVNINNVSFYHLRLSILDISGGAQPMQLNDRYSIIYNGQIYNHVDLRKEHNLICKTNSDTETLLHLYVKFGEKMLDMLDGMFVFCIYDKEENKLFIARDRAGEKPLYIYNDNKKIVFASELNCLRSLLPLEIDIENFSHYTRIGTFYRQLTPYKNVSELEPGTFLIIDPLSLKIEKRNWWNVNNFYKKSSGDDLGTAINKVDEMLHVAIKRRIESSDLEVGCFLSGGIDSGLVTSIASKFSPGIKTFTVSFPGAYNEFPLAKLVAEKYKTNHTEISISFDDLINDVEKIILNYGEPYFDSSAIPSYYVSREAKKHVTVILNGDGADELFGGYRRYVPFSKFDFFKSNNLIKSLASIFIEILPQPQDKKSKLNFLYRLAGIASKSGLEIYLSAGIDLIEGYEKNIILKESLDMDLMRNDFKRIVSTEMSGLKKIMNLDFDVNLCSDLLVKMDIATMAHSLEGRSPFLSKELLEYAPTINDSFKINKTTTKHLLRELAKKYLPSELIHQPKRGFEIPLKNWVNGVLKDMIADYILSDSALNKSILNQSFVEKLVDSKIRIPAEKRAKILWMIFCMEVWYKNQSRFIS